jgi:hypothetical protein
MIDERRLAVAVAVAVVYRMMCERVRREVPEVMHCVSISGCLEADKNRDESW